MFLRVIFCAASYICVGAQLFAGFNFSHETSTIRLGNSSETASLYLSGNVTGWDGTLWTGANGTISNATSKTIGFANGVLDTNGVRSRLTATFQPGGSPALTLGANQMLYAEPGEIVQSITVGGAGAKIEGQPTFAGAIDFDADATLYLGIQSRLNQNIQFDSGGTNTLYLNDDLRLEDNVTIVNEGTIDVNNKAFWFGGKPLTLANTIYWKNAGDINLSNKVTFNGTWHVDDETTLNGHGNVLDVSGGGVFDVAASTTLYLTDVVLKGITDSTFAFGDNGSTVRFSGGSIHLAETVTHNQGLFYIDGQMSMFLPGVNWNFNGDSNITVSGVTLWRDELDQAGTSDIAGNMTMVYNGTIKEVFSGGDLDTLYDRVENNSNTIIELDGRMETAEGDITNLEGRMDTAESDIDAVEGRLDTAEPKIEANSAAITHNWDYTVANSTSIVQLDGRMTTAESDIDSVESRMTTAEGDITSLEGRMDTAESDIDAVEGRLDTEEPRIEANSAAITHNWNYTVANSTSIVQLDGRMETAETNITNNDTDIATNAANIKTTDNLVKYIHGPGSITLDTNTTFTVDVHMSNNHVFTIDDDLEIDGDNHSIVFAKGDTNVLNVGSNALTLKDVTLKDFSPGALSVTTGSITFGDGAVIDITGNQTLASGNYTMSFNGSVELNCHGNEFDISGREHAFDILAGGTLTINNARIKGLGGTKGNGYTNNIRCLDTEGKLVLKNCELVMEDNFTFGQGSLDIFQDVAISGPENPSGTSLVFAYQSAQPATIKSIAKLMLDRYVTFSYDSNAASKEKIVMEDATSILHLNGCTLYSTHTGLQLTGGRLIVEDKVTVQNEASNQDEAMVFKDPLDIDVLSGGVLDLTDGLLEYQ